MMAHQHLKMDLYKTELFIPLVATLIFIWTHGTNQTFDSFVLHGQCIPIGFTASAIALGQVSLSFLNLNPIN